MTPAINSLKKAQIKFRIHEYQHDAASESYGVEAAEKLGINQQRLFKTLVVKLDGMDLAVAVLPVSSMLSMKTMAKHSKAKKAVMAEPSEVERSTGYVLGGVSPIGQKKRLNTLVDQSAINHESIYISAGRRGLEIELAPDDLVQLLNGKYCGLAL